MTLLDDRLAEVLALAGPTDGCIPWPHTLTKNGYPYVNRSYAHRAACVLAHGEPPDPTLEAAHSCRNPPCVNPRHLSWKTHAGNMADIVTHGTAHRGEASHLHKLTEDQAREAFALRSAGSRIQPIADRFGVTRACISHLLRGNSWAWLELDQSTTTLKESA